MSAAAPASPAEAYQAYYGPAIFEPLTERVIATACPPTGSTVLDIASGTGILTRRLAEAVGSTGSVLGVDLNPKMVEVATRLGSGGTVEYRVGDGTALDLADASFDAVYCQQGLQFFPDRAAGAREMARVVRAGGRAVAATWHGLAAHPLFAALVDAEEPHLAANGVEVHRAELEAPFSFGDADQLRTLFLDAGFGAVDIHAVSIEARFADADNFVERMEFAYAAVIPQFAQEPDTFRAYLDAIADDTRDIIAAYRDGDLVVVPMHANLAVATR